MKAAIISKQFYSVKLRRFILEELDSLYVVVQAEGGIQLVKF